MEVKVVDNFLDLSSFNQIKELIVNDTLPFFVQETVADDSEEYHLNKELWNTYYVHLLYYDDRPQSPYLDRIGPLILPKLYDGWMRSLMRMKVNLYPHTETLREHGQHTDSTFPQNAAVFSLNTCDGFTRMEDGTKIESVENRIVFFDATRLHNSSTTTTAKGRYNINFNFL